MEYLLSLIKKEHFDGILNNEEFYELREKILKSIVLGDCAKKLFCKVVSVSENGQLYDPVYPEMENSVIGQITQWLQGLKKLKEKATPQEFEFWKEALLYGDRDFMTSVATGVESGRTLQRKDFGFIREDGASSLRETVFNFFSKENNFPYSFLVFKDLKTGMYLDLQQLLPADKNFFFRPSVMIPCKNGERGKIVFDKCRNLEDYNGTKFIKRRENDIGFSMFDSALEGTVAYENLIEKGGMLSLFHEIAHTWQRKGGFFCEVEKIFRIIENLLIKDIPAEKINKFLLKHKNFPELVINSLEAEEGAWDSARQVILFLRNCGVDLESQMCFDEDFNTTKERCLKTYSDFVRNKLKSIQFESPI
ncbi:MAG TPA: hypothetical protein P5548_01940 [Candidatus Moranbacteria bacterium]|nr:hypothetical protein [Candidatus Moranbacteria bacterium]HRZ33636.1 hypothetical protein [Candidatus Moranbacteria bacterium]